MDPRSFRQQGPELFEAIPHCYQTAILELLNLDHYHSNPKWIAEKLNIPLDEAVETVEILLQTNQIEIDKKGKYVLRECRTSTVGSAVFSQILKQKSIQFLEKQILALKTMPS